ncbi:MAG: hypothetical protein AB8B99_10505 [Phormidesmis sp.]
MGRPADMPPHTTQRHLTQHLYAAWQQSVNDNKLINQFQAVVDDPDGRWVKGDTIAFGVHGQPAQKADQSTTTSPSQNVYYAQNLTQSRPIPGAVQEKSIPGLGFICQYNGYRALRPGGQLKPLGRQVDIPPEPERCRFSCQDASDPLSLLVREPLLQVPLTNYVWNAYYNAAPIDPDGHFLWVPTDDAVLTHYPQALSLAFVEDAVSLFKQLDGTLLFFNSLHSGASVNHIHFQAIAHRTPLPVETWPLIFNQKGYALLANYPAYVMAFDINNLDKKVSSEAVAMAVFLHIDRFQQQDIPFNLMFVGTRILLMPRNIDHEIVSEFPGNGIAALGMCGKIITVDYQAYAKADRHRIQAAFAKMTSPVA